MNNNEDFFILLEDNEFPILNNYSYNSDDIYVEEKHGYRYYYKLDKNYIINEPFYEERWVLIYEEKIDE